MRLKRPIFRNTAGILLVWSALVGLSYHSSVSKEREQTLRLATNTARASFDKDQAYRRWASTHGGVYVFPDERTPPSPYLAHLPDRDLTTEDGRLLTLMNPAYMLRQMMQEFGEQYGIKGRITGLIYLNPANAPDEWETGVLGSFEAGTEEVIEPGEIDGAPFLRLMRPMIMEQSCMKCHGHLGYKVGDVRGGVSVAVPLEPYLITERQTVHLLARNHLFIWAIGLVGILLAAIRAYRLEQERRQHLAELTLSATVFENGMEGVLITDPDGVILRVNPVFTAITGYTPEEAIGATPAILRSNQHDQEFYDHLWGSLLSVGHWQGEIWNRRKSGEGFTAWENISAVRNEDGQAIYYVAILRDITEMKASEERIHRLAHFDVLTGLPNRYLLMDRLSHAIEVAQRREQRLALMFIDLDAFKNVNDSLGHPAGDSLLKLVAERMQTVLREGDTLARLGGDEFLLLLEEFGEPLQTERVAHRLLEGFARPFSFGDHQTTIGASIGISLFPKDADDADTLIKHADIAMYRVKEDGRNGYAFYDQEMAQRALLRFRTEGELRLALERDEFRLFYQPQFDLRQRRIVGYEALVRWAHPSRGLLAPDSFIPCAEETGLILQTGRWVLREACRQAMEWCRNGEPLRIAVNISAEQFRRSDLTTTVREVLEESALPPHLLELEITEGLMLSDFDAALATLRALKGLGVTIALDDFGTGYSSLSYLKHLPLDCVKIDRSFIQGLPDDPEDRALSVLIIRIAETLNLRVVAEGIETEPQRAFLEECGCHEIQGFLIARPQPAAELGIGVN